MLLVCLGLCLNGCATASRTEKKDAQAPAKAPHAETPPPPQSEDAQLAVRNEGYSLLYHLLSDEKNLSKILLIKKEQSDVGDLIKKISQTADEGAKQLDALAKSDSHLHLNMEGLPQVEKETRDLIGKTREKELIAKTGEKFELRILLTQSEALTYGVHLAEAVQKHETDPARRKFLGELYQQLENLHQSLINLMHARWQMPENGAANARR